MYYKSEMHKSHFYRNTNLTLLDKHNDWAKQNLMLFRSVNYNICILRIILSLQVDQMNCYKYICILKNKSHFFQSGFFILILSYVAMQEA